MSWLQRLIDWVIEKINSTFTHGVSEPPTDEEQHPQK